MSLRAWSRRTFAVAFVAAATACSFDLADVATDAPGGGDGGGTFDAQQGTDTGPDPGGDGGGGGPDGNAADSPAPVDGNVTDAPIDVARDTAPPDTGVDAGPTRVTSGIVVLYTFKEATGAIVHDVSGVAPAYDLTIDVPANTTWINGGLRVDTPATLANQGTPTKIRTPIETSNELTLEAWVTPAAATTPTSSGRIVELGKGAQTDFDLAQVNTSWGGTLRVAGGSTAFSAGVAVAVARIHYVFARETAGKWVTYINGAATGSGSLVGTFSQVWDVNAGFSVANSPVNDRPFLGLLNLVAIYSRALTPQEVLQNYNVGP